MPGMGRLTGLDALRGIAALCVVVFHITAYSNLPTGKGYLAVDFFLMLSGYVLARTYESRIAEGLGASRFFAIRYRRLWPAVALGMSLGLATGVAITPFEVVCGFLMIPLWRAGWAFPLNNPIWSTSLELLLNVLHVGAFARVSRQALFLAVGLSVLATIPLLDHGHGLEGGPANGQFGFALLRGLIAYPLGIVLWRTWRDRPPFRVPVSISVLTMPTLLAISAAFHAPPLADYLFVLVVCPVLIAGGLQITSRWGSWLGAVSFPLYAIHNPLIRLAINVSLPAWIGGLLALALVGAYVQVNSIMAARRSNRWPEITSTKPVQ